MKYSLRSLFVVVTLAAVVSGFVARSRYCAERAAFHRKQLPASEIELRFTLKVLEEARRQPLHIPSAYRTPRFARMEAQLRFHQEAVIAYERASRMPWLPVRIPPEPPPTENPE